MATIGTPLQDAVVLVTGANGGLGTEFVRQALQRGAVKVYASARTPQEWDDPRVVPLALDVTDAESVRAAAEAAPDVSVLINNAGVLVKADLVAEPDAGRALFDVNFWGQLDVTSAFVPALERSGGGIVNVLSALSWLATSDFYSASKAALWSATNSQRLTLAPRGIQVVGLALALTDTPMTSGRDEPKGDPADVVRDAYDGLESGAHEVLADDPTRQVRAALSGPVEALYPELASGA